jgi:hypothetical protein
MKHLDQPLKKYKLGTLFDIFSGIVDDGSEFYFLNDKQEEEELTILRMAAFDPINKRLMEIGDIKSNQEKIEAMRQKRNLDSIRKEVPKRKVLTPNDYLLCIRTANNKPVNGYSLINSPIHLQPKMIGPTIVPNHFICFRPRLDMENLHIPYLHTFLDALIEINFIPLIQEGNKNLLKIKFMNELTVAIPQNLEDQKELYDTNRELELKKVEIQRDIEALMAQITGEFQQDNMQELKLS